MSTIPSAVDSWKWNPGTGNRCFDCVRTITENKEKIKYYFS